MDVNRSQLGLRLFGVESGRMVPGYNTERTIFGRLESSCCLRYQWDKGSIDWFWENPDDKGGSLKLLLIYGFVGGFPCRALFQEIQRFSSIICVDEALPLSSSSWTAHVSIVFLSACAGNP
jgi:hypothetical protein